MNKTTDTLALHITELIGYSLELLMTAINTFNNKDKNTINANLK